MKCPQCQFENREGASFCLECGAKLEMSCPKCGKALPPTAKFCDGCGNNLALVSEQPARDLSFDEKIAKIQRYLPSEGRIMVSKEMGWEPRPRYLRKTLTDPTPSF